MSLRFSITLVLIAGALSAPMAFQSSGDDEGKTITGRELLQLAQGSRKVNYTFDHATARALETTELERPAPSASGEELERRLREAGFVLEPVGSDDLKVFRVRTSS